MQFARSQTVRFGRVKSFSRARVMNLVTVIGRFGTGVNNEYLPLLSKSRLHVRKVRIITLLSTALVRGLCRITIFSTTVFQPAFD